MHELALIGKHVIVSCDQRGNSTDWYCPQPDKPAFRFLGHSCQRVERKYQITNTLRDLKLWTLILTTTCVLSLQRCLKERLKFFSSAPKISKTPSFSVNLSLSLFLSLFIYIIIADCYIFSGYMRNDIQKCFLVFQNI